jgi:large subunit ribosomal protein L17
MRHQKAGRTFGRRADHRHAMMSNLVASLILAERIRTTDPKAKELRRLVERTITWGTSLGDLLTRDEEKLSVDERARVVHHMRMARRVCKQPEALAKLFRDVAPRFLGRPGGYTRILKIGQRPGDAAPVSLIELIGAEIKAAAAEEKPGKGKGVKAKADKAEAAEEKPGKGKGGKVKAAAAEEKPAKAKGSKAKAPKAEKASEKPAKASKKKEK